MSISVFGLAWFASASLAQQPDVQAKAPNVVLILCDDLGWGDTGFQGSPVARTPHLDEMARNGIRFERFYAAAPVCSPTRGSMLTGRHPYRYGITHANTGRLPDREFTLAEALREAGYATGHFGKWHLGTMTTEVVDANRGRPGRTEVFAPPWLHGFDACFSTESKVPTWDPMWKPAEGPWRNGWNPIEDIGSAVPYGTRYWSESGQAVDDPLRGSNARLIMDRALSFIDGAIAEEMPFLAVVWFHTPHLPVVSGDPWRSLYPDQDDYEKNYFGSISAMDAQVGRLRQLLRARGVAHDTLLWFASDNGPERNTPGRAGGLRGGKRTLWEGGIRVPGVVEWPARFEGNQVSAYPASTSDVLPTVLAAARIEERPKLPLDGLDLLPALTGGASRRASPIRFVHREGATLRQAQVGQRYKLVIESFDDPARGEEVHLYDLQTDPIEARNLVERLPERVLEMRRDLNSWFDGLSDGVDAPADR